ncbi:MAG: hypothetical protein PVI57_17300 [Gemmatimonadota bacterium]
MKLRAILSVFALVVVVGGAVALLVPAGTILMGTLGDGFNVFGLAPAVAYGLFAVLFLSAGPLPQPRGA